MRTDVFHWSRAALRHPRETTETYICTKESAETVKAFTFMRLGSDWREWEKSAVYYHNQELLVSCFSLSANCASRCLTGYKSRCSPTGTVSWARQEPGGARRGGGKERSASLYSGKAGLG